MATPTDDRRTEVEAGVAQVTFTYDFDITDADDLRVFVVPLATGIPTEVTTRVASPTPASGEFYVDPAFNVTKEVTLNAANVDATDDVVILGDRDVSRITTFSTQGDFEGGVVTAEYENLRRLIEENSRDLDRTISLSAGSTNSISLALPDPITSDAILKINAAGTAIELIAGGSGDVTGPTTSTDTAVPRWSGTSGLLLLDSGVLIDSSDNITGVVNFTASGLSTLATVDINGGAIDGTDIGQASTGLITGSSILSTSTVRGSTEVQAGQSDTTSGNLVAFGNASSAGGDLQLHLGQNENTDIDSYLLSAGTTGDDDLTLRSSGGTGGSNELLRISRLGNITVTAGITGASLDLASGASVTSIDITTAADSDTALVTSQGINEAIATAVGAANSLQEAYNVDEVIITTSGGADPVLLKTVLADDPVASPETQFSGAKVFVTQDSTGVEGVSITSGGSIKYTRDLTCNAISFPAVQAVDVDQGRSGLNFGVSGEYLHWSIYSDSAETTPASSEHVTFFNVERSGNEYDATTKTITGITKANPAVFTCTGHSFTDKDSIHISGVTSSTNDDFADAINNSNWNVNYIDANSFSLQTKAELGNYTAFSTSGYTGTYNTGGTAQKKGITVDRIWMKMGRTEHATDGGDIVDIFDAQYNGGVSPHLTIGADATVTGKLSLGASDFQIDPTPGAGVLDLISDTTACSLRVQSTGGTTVAALSVTDGVGTILSSSTTGTKDLILKVNGGLGTTVMTADGTTGYASFAGNVTLPTDNSTLNVGTLIDAAYSLSVECLANNNVSGIKIMRDSSATQNISIGSYTQNLIQASGSTKEFVINQTSASDLVLQHGTVDALNIDSSLDVTLAGELNVTGGINLDSAWTAPTLAANWTNFSGSYQSTRYCKDANGWVHIEGHVGNSVDTGATAVFTLPAGFRPALHLLFMSVGDNNACRIQVTSAGVVSLGGNGTYAVYASLNCSFYVGV